MEIHSEERVQVRFTVDREFTDAFYFTAEERAALSDDALDAMMVDRYNAWKAAVATPPREPTKEEQQEAVDALLLEQARLDVAIAKLDPAVIEGRKEVLGIPIESGPGELQLLKG